ncbi:MAG TPA: hypothetical protein VGF75_02140 [Candidatus Saccharimonadales bacterium]|jgi:hypothetical protein
MHKKLVDIRANRVIGKYKTYSEFSRHASKSEKKLVFESTILEANKLQRTTANVK